MKFLIWKRDSFYKVKEIKGLCGGEPSFDKPANLQIDAEIVENSRFRTETLVLQVSGGFNDRD
jgi:hypothetical protein